MSHVLWPLLVSSILTKQLLPRLSLAAYRPVAGH